jgi:hypothetical protein
MDNSFSSYTSRLLFDKVLQKMCLDILIEPFLFFRFFMSLIWNSNTMAAFHIYVLSFFLRKEIGFIHCAHILLRSSSIFSKIENKSFINICKNLPSNLRKDSSFWCVWSEYIFIVDNRSYLWSPDRYLTQSEKKAEHLFRWTSMFYILK